MVKCFLVFGIFVFAGCVMRTPDDCSFYSGASRSACERDLQAEHVERAYSTSAESVQLRMPVEPAVQAVYGQLSRVVSGSEILLDVQPIGLVLVHLEGVQDTLANEVLLQQYFGQTFQIVILNKITSVEWVALLYDDSGGQLSYLLE